MFRCTVYRSHTSMSLITYFLFEKWLGIAIMKAMPQSRQKRIYNRPNNEYGSKFISRKFECQYVYNINTILNEKLFQLTYQQESGIFADTGSLNSTMILRSPPRWCNIPCLTLEVRAKHDTCSTSRWQLPIPGTNISDWRGLVDRYTSVGCIACYLFIACQDISWFEAKGTPL